MAAVRKAITQIYPGFNPNDERARARLLINDAYMIGVLEFLVARVSLG